MQRTLTKPFEVLFLVEASTEPRPWVTKRVGGADHVLRVTTDHVVLLPSLINW